MLYVFTLVCSLHSFSVKADCLNEIKSSKLKDISVALVKKLSSKKSKLTKDKDFNIIKGTQNRDTLNINIESYLIPPTSFLIFFNQQGVVESLCEKGILPLKENEAPKALFEIRALHWNELTSNLMKANPTNDAIHSFKKKNYNFRGIHGFVPNVPVGLSASEIKKIVNYKVIPFEGTGDVIESHEHQKYIETASKYAKEFNQKLFSLIFYRKK
jgi:hypothetical protein